jgi:hypothetical protein
VAYKRSLKNGGSNISSATNLKEEDPNNGAIPSWQRGHKITKADLECGASTLAISETLKGLMAKKEKAVTRRDEKRHYEKEDTCVLASLTSQRGIL